MTVAQSENPSFLGSIGKMLKARNNPFATDRLEKRLQFVPLWSGLSWGEIDSSIGSLQNRCAIVGDHGTGKTTLLEALARRYRANGDAVVSLFYNDRTRPDLVEILQRRKEISSRTMVFCDGSESLRLWHWLALLHVTQHARGLIVSGHTRAKLPVAVRLESSAELVARVLEEVDSKGDWGARAEIAPGVI